MPSTIVWIGNALAVVQVDILTPAVVSIGSIFAVAINGKTITFTATATTAANVSAGLVALLTASTIPEFAEITWTDGVGTIVATANTAGYPFTLTQTAGGTGSPTFGRAATVVCTGPNFFDNTKNWSTGIVPVTGDTVYFENSSISCQYALAQSGVVLAALNIGMSFTGDIGLPKNNASGGYHEYRTDYLQIYATACQVGYGNGQGSGRIKLDTLTANTCTMTVINTGNGNETNLPALLWRSSKSTNVLVVESGSVGVSVFGDEVATIATATVESGAVEAGPGTTLTIFTQNGDCSTLIRGALGTANINAGSPTMTGSGGITTLNLNAGQLIHSSSGTVATANIGLDGRSAILDRSGTAIGGTLTNTAYKKGGQILGSKTIAYSNAPTLDSGIDTLTAA